MKVQFLLELKYAKELLVLWSDYEVVKYTHNPWCKTVQECEARIQHIQQFIDSLHMNNWVILYGEQVIGVAGVPTISHEKGGLSPTIISCSLTRSVKKCQIFT